MRLNNTVALITSARRVPAIGAPFCMPHVKIRLAIDDRARQSGVIIHNSSSCGLVAGDRTVAYFASKGRVVLLRKAMATDHGRQGIPVKSIWAGGVDTPIGPQAKFRGIRWHDSLASVANPPMGRSGRGG